MERGLELIDGVFTAAWETRGGLENVYNRNNRLRTLCHGETMYDEWVFESVENDKAVFCICGMPANPGRSVILKNISTKLRAYIGSSCLKQFPNVDPSVLDYTLDGYSRKDQFIVDDDEEDEEDDDILTSDDDSSSPAPYKLRSTQSKKTVLKQSDDETDDDEIKNRSRSVSPQYALRSKTRKRALSNPGAIVQKQHSQQPQTKAYEACQDFFLRQNHTRTEEIVFIGYLRSLFTQK